MYSRFALAKKYLQYYLTASNGRGHGVHSPFVYDLIRNVLNDGARYPAYEVVEGLRRRLLADRSVVEVKDLGAGSALGVAVSGGAGAGGLAGVGDPSALGRMSERRVCDIARNAAKPRKLGQLLFRIARYYKAGRVLELGTSMGLSTAYLCLGVSDGHVWTIEGAPAVAAVAEGNLRSVGCENVEVVVGNFDDRMEEVLDRAGGFDLAFVDGNHRLEPTLRYFHMLMSRAPGACILIFDDIHWSEEMEEAWDVIRQDPRVYMTIDLFFIGLVVLRDEFKVKQDFAVRF